MNGGGGRPWPPRGRWPIPSPAPAQTLIGVSRATLGRVGDLDFITYEDSTICPYCGRRVEPDGRDVIYARKQVDGPASGQPHDLVDGEEGFFHAGCPPEDVGYAQRPRPNS